MDSAFLIGPSRKTEMDYWAVRTLLKVIKAMDTQTENTQPAGCSDETLGPVPEMDTMTGSLTRIRLLCQKREHLFTYTLKDRVRVTVAACSQVLRFLCRMRVA